MVHFSLVQVDIFFFASGSSSRTARRANLSTLPSLERSGTAPRPRGSTTVALAKRDAVVGISLKNPSTVFFCSVDLFGGFVKHFGYI